MRRLQKPESQEALVKTRALLQYIGPCKRPDIFASIQLLASEVSTPTSERYKKMSKVVKWCRNTSGIGLNFVPLDQETMRLALFIDASFPNARNLKSQLGFLVVLMDGKNNANILHYGSASCRKVTFHNTGKIKYEHYVSRFSWLALLPPTRKIL